MRNLKFSFIAILVGIIFYSCDHPCDRVDCKSDNLYGRFRILSEANEDDLVFGSTSIYDKNSFKFYSLNGIDTIFFDYKPTHFPGNDFDSILQILFFPKTEIAYMSLSNGNVDTLNITYKTTNSNTQCCESFTEIVNFRLNDSLNIPTNLIIQVIRK